MNGVQTQMQEQYEYMMDSFEISIVVSDAFGGTTDRFAPGEAHIERFTDPETLWSLADFVTDIQLRRTLEIIDQSDDEEMLKASLMGIEPLTEEGIRAYYKHFGFPEADNMILELSDEYLDILEEYAEYDISLGDLTDIAIISEDLMEHVKDGVLTTAFIEQRGPNVRVNENQFNVAGVLRNSGLETLIITSNSTLSYISMQLFGLWISPSPMVTDGGFELAVTFSDEITVMSQSGSELGSLIGITPAVIDDDTEISFTQGYDKHIFATNEHVCVISDDMSVLVEDGILRTHVFLQAGVKLSAAEVELKVVGTVAAEKTVFAPFLSIHEIAGESAGFPQYTEVLQAVVADNRKLNEFKENAMRVYKDIGVFFNEQTFAMTIHDAEFYDITEALQQTIFFIDIATPFVYVLSISIGFVTSYLLTRRRKAEFANMRSIGVNKIAIFFSALFEQTVLCAVGVAIGCGLFTLTWDYVFIEEPLIFLGCYVLGAIFSAANAAGTDVLRLLRAKE